MTETHTLETYLRSKDINYSLELDNDTYGLDIDNKTIPFDAKLNKKSAHELPRMIVNLIHTDELEDPESVIANCLAHKVSEIYGVITDNNGRHVVMYNTFRSLEGVDNLINAIKEYDRVLHSPEYTSQIAQVNTFMEGLSELVNLES